MNLNQEATLKLDRSEHRHRRCINVRVHDELPEASNYVSSLPEMHVSGDGHT